MTSSPGSWAGIPALALVAWAAFASPDNALPDGRVSVHGVQNFAVVSPVLYRGAQPTAEGFRELRARGVTTIIDLRAGHDDEKRLAGLGFSYYWLRTRQWHPESEDVIKAMKIILSPDYQPVFVHCQAGKDRTGLVVAVYQVLFGNKSVDEAIAERNVFGAHAFWEENVHYLQRLRDPAARQALLDAITKAPMPVVVKIP